MSEAHAVQAVQATTSKEIERAVAVYIKRCTLLMKDAFRRNLDERREFLAWIEKKFQDSRDPIVLLHEDPLYMVCRYLAIPPLDIHSSIRDRATRIAKDQRW